MEIITATTIEGGATTMSNVSTRVESTVPSQYRLARTRDGTLVLQGMFEWHEGSAHGHEWREIPTVELEPAAPESAARGKTLGEQLDDIEDKGIEVGFDAFTQKLSEDLKAYTKRGASFLGFVLSPAQSKRLHRWAIENGLEERVRIQNVWGWPHFMFSLNNSDLQFWPTMQFSVDDGWVVRPNGERTQTLTVPESAHSVTVTTSAGGGGALGGGGGRSEPFPSMALPDRPSKPKWRWRFW